MLETEVTNQASTKPTFPREGEICVASAMVSVWEDSVDEAAMMRVFHSVVGRMRFRGWHVVRDPETVKNYPTLANRKRVGTKGELRFHAETFGRQMKIEFYQEVNTVNPNGGRYDFDKIRLMPRHLRSLCIVEMVAVVRKLMELGYSLPRTLHEETLMRDVLRAAENDKSYMTPLERFNDTWNSECDWERGGRFKRDETGWPCVSEYDHGYNRDRDGVPLRNGMVRYWRDWKGHLMRCTVYTNMNCMWMLVANGTVLSYETGGLLFDCPRPDLEKRRLVPGQAKRVQKELAKATEAKDWKRVAVLARVLDKLGQDKAAGR